VAIPYPLRTASIALAGGALYFALLWFFYTWAPYTAIPHWWRHLSPNAAAAVVAWFTLLNVGGAILAAIPVALGVVFSANTRRVVLGLVIGLMPALYIAVSGCIEYGVPSNLEAWVVDTAQFVAVSLAVVGALALIRGLPSNNRFERSRGASSVAQGESR
jgi:hypothetical protein